MSEHKEMNREQSESFKKSRIDEDYTSQSNHIFK